MSSRHSDSVELNDPVDAATVGAAQPRDTARAGLKPVRRANLPASIAEQLRRQIAAGEFAPGQQLPGHRELASIFSVSVGSVREAISMLVSAGLIEARAGWGTFVAVAPVNSAGDDPLAPPLERKEIRELIEARETIELQVVTSAAERATPEQIERLKNALDRMDAAAGDPKAYGEADVEFHATLAEAADNRILMKAMVEIRARLKSDIELSVEALIRRFGDVRYSVEQHRQLVDAVEQGDVKRARALSLDMMNRNHEFLMSLYGLASPRLAAAGAGLEGDTSSVDPDRYERDPFNPPDAV